MYEWPIFLKHSWFIRMQKSHGTVLTCICGRSGGALSFTFEDLCFPLWLSELFDRINRQDYKLCCFNMEFIVNNRAVTTCVWTDATDCLRDDRPFSESRHFSRLSLPLSLPLPLSSDSSLELYMSTSSWYLQRQIKVQRNLWQTHYRHNWHPCFLTELSCSLQKLPEHSPLFFGQSNYLRSVQKISSKSFSTCYTFFSNLPAAEGAV